ncbi:MAG: alpha/beta fold hydrolase [Chloroflexi bacterium]|nr:alpha/beta fold hydrolase [Chloroflexota bacterium]
MPKAFLNGINLYYEDNGSGFPIIFTHGYAGTTKSWQGQVAAFSKKYRFITYDMRGHGQTDAPADLSKYALEYLIEDIYQLLRHLGIKKAVVGGLSLGGYLTLHFYRQHPDMAAAIILMGTGPGYRTPEKAKDWNETRLECAKILETGGIKAFMASKYSAEDYYTAPDVMMKHNPKGLANISRGLMQNPWGLDILPTIKVPTLVVCGERDANFLTATDYMVSKIPGAQKAIIAGAGHGVNIDQPQLFESTVLGFLGKLNLK